MASQGGAYTKYYFLVPLVIALFLALIWVIVFMNDAEPVSYTHLDVYKRQQEESSRVPF